MMTINELKKNGMLKTDVSYQEASELLQAYYEGGERDKQIREALKGVSSDKYYKIIPLYYGYNYTIEQIAEVLQVETSTVTRNKKRLCLKIYSMIDRSE